MKHGQALPACTVRHIADLQRGEIAYLPDAGRWTGPFRVISVADTAAGGFALTIIRPSTQGHSIADQEVNRDDAMRGARVVLGQLGPEPRPPAPRTTRKPGWPKGRPRPFIARTTKQLTRTAV